MRGSVLCLLMIAGAFAGAARGAEFEVLGYRLGASIGVEAEAITCSADPAAIAATRCQLQRPETRRWHGVALKSLTLYASDDKIVALEAQLPETEFGRLLAVLRADYGAGQAEREKLRAGMGGVFENEIVTWTQSEVVLRAEQFFRKIDRSAVILAPQSLLPRLAPRKSGENEMGIKDL